MIWTYRVFCDHAHRYSIREVFYEPDGTMIGYSKTPVALIGNSPEDMLQQLTWFREAFDLPILSMDETDASIAVPSQTRSASQPTMSFQAVQALLRAESPQETSDCSPDKATITTRERDSTAKAAQGAGSAD